MFSQNNIFHYAFARYCTTASKYPDWLVVRNVAIDFLRNTILVYSMHYLVQPFAYICHILWMYYVGLAVIDILKRKIQLIFVKFNLTTI